MNVRAPSDGRAVMVGSVSPERFTCPVCGFPDLPDRPRSPSGSASDEICESCGFQFGWTDVDQGWSDAAWRARWVAAGMPWSALGTPPPTGWDPAAQLRRAGLAG